MCSLVRAMCSFCSVSRSTKPLLEREIVFVRNFLSFVFYLERLVGQVHVFLL
jgi:hypothetical protein